jgi:hypothetical protein
MCNVFLLSDFFIRALTFVIFLTRLNMGIPPAKDHNLLVDIAPILRHAIYEIHFGNNQASSLISFYCTFLLQLCCGDG